MKIAIISDTHDNLANLKKAVDWIKKEKIKTIIHCGDIFKPETIKEILKIFKGEIYIIFSPADADFTKIPKDSFKNLPRTKIYEEFGKLKITGKKIAFTHFPEIAKTLAATQEYDMVFYGHTHKPSMTTSTRFYERKSFVAKQVEVALLGKPWEQKIRKTRLVNPGNIAGIFYKPTFAVYDTKTNKLELKILEKL